MAATVRVPLTRPTESLLGCSIHRVRLMKQMEGAQERLPAMLHDSGRSAQVAALRFHDSVFCKKRRGQYLHLLAAVASASSGVQVPTKEGAQTLLHTLPSGARLEVLVQKAQKAVAGKPPFVFIHGSYHAAWCWAEFWMPFFSSIGHDCYAISLLGQGGSDVPDAKVAGTVETHAADVADVIRTLLPSPPILVGHSFGGCIVQAYLALVGPDFPGAGSGAGTSSSSSSSPPQHPSLAAAVLACSVPPTGNSKMVMRFLKTRPLLDTFKITWSLAARGFANTTWLCRESFFSPSMPEADVQRYQQLLSASSKLPLFDLRQLNATLPVPKPPAHAPPILILAAENDFVVDDEGVRETSSFYSAPIVVVPAIAHDIMLDAPWQRAAESLMSWLIEAKAST